VQSNRAFLHRLTPLRLLYVWRNRAATVDQPFRTAQPPLDCIRFVGTVRLLSATARATAARRDGGSRIAHGTQRQVFFRRGPSHRGLRSRATIAGMAWFRARTRTFCRRREYDSGQTRPKPMIMGTEGFAQRNSCRHSGACLRRAMFSTRNTSRESAAPPPRSLPAWCGVQTPLPPLPICTSVPVPTECRKNIAPPGQAGLVAEGGHSVWFRTWLHGGKHRGGPRGRADRPDERPFSPGRDDDAYHFPRPDRGSGRVGLGLCDLGRSSYSLLPPVSSGGVTISRPCRLLPNPLSEPDERC